MKTVMIVILMLVGLVPAPMARADNSDVLTGAVILLGAAAIANRVRRDNNEGGLSPDERSEFQRGYRDGLNYVVFDVSGGTDRYLEGYRTGISERNARVDNHRQHVTPRLPVEFSRACRVRAAEGMTTTPGAIQITRTRIDSPTRFGVEVRQERRFAHCNLNRRAEVVRYSAGRF
jgi:hypothetical protein